MNNDVKQIIYSYGADVCGIADIERFAAAPPVFHHRICLETVNLSLYLDARFPGE